MKQASLNVHAAFLSLAAVVAMTAAACSDSNAGTEGGNPSSAGSPSSAGAGTSTAGANAMPGAGAPNGAAGTSTGGSAGSSSSGGAAGSTATAGAAGASLAGAGGAPATGGSGGAAGAPGGGGTGGATGGAGSGGSAGGGPGPLLGTATRPQISASAAANFTVLKYLAQFGAVTGPTVDNWDPTAGLPNTSTFTPTYTVAKTGGTQATVQAAIDAATAAGGTNRVYILVKPDTYREVVCVKAGGPPITLYGGGADASATVIVFNNYSGKPKAETDSANPCSPNTGTGKTTFGTAGSATFAAYADGFQAKNLTFANDLDESTVAAGAATAAVAFLAQADKVVLDGVRLLGNQDTFFAKTGATATIERVYVKNSYIEGDVDFIFGRATIVVDGGTIQFVGARVFAAGGAKQGYVMAPSTDSRNPYGILINGAHYTADASTPTGTISLGRAWDESQVDLPTFATNVASGIYTNGQGLVRGAVLGAHIRPADPWSSAATTKRPYSSTAGTYPANRLYEYGNTGPGAAQ